MDVMKVLNEWDLCEKMMLTKEDCASVAVHIVFLIGTGHLIWYLWLKKLGTEQDSSDAQVWMDQSHDSLGMSH